MKKGFQILTMHRHLVGPQRSVGQEQGGRSCGGDPKTKSAAKPNLRHTPSEPRKASLRHAPQQSSKHAARTRHASQHGFAANRPQTPHGETTWPSGGGHGMGMRGRCPRHGGSGRRGSGPARGNFNLAPPALGPHLRPIGPYELEVATSPSHELGFYRSATGLRAC